MNYFQRIILIFLSISILFVSCQEKNVRILVFSKTAGYRHSSIETGKMALIELGKENSFSVYATEDASYFTENNLKKYAAVVFLNTTGNILDDRQQADFERYIQAGGGYVGIHAATDTEFDWPWYNRLAGAYFQGHPAIQEAELITLDWNHPSTTFLDSTWQFTDEWYNFKSMYNGINPLVELNEESYYGGNHEGAHPISWYHAYDGGRAFYTGLGHREETYDNPIFIKHILGGIQYAIGEIYDK